MPAKLSIDYIEFAFRRLLAVAETLLLAHPTGKRVAGAAAAAAHSSSKSGSREGATRCSRAGAVAAGLLLAALLLPSATAAGPAVDSSYNIVSPWHAYQYLLSCSSSRVSILFNARPAAVRPPAMASLLPPAVHRPRRRGSPPAMHPARPRLSYADCTAGVVQLFAQGFWRQVL